MAAFTMDMDRYMRLRPDDRRAVDDWVYTYVKRCKCFRFDLAEDGDGLAARFYLYDRDKYEPGMPGIPSHTVDVFGVAPCPVA